MTPEQLRQSLKELDGSRDATFGFAGMPSHESAMVVRKAMLIPDEPDHLVKVTDGESIFIIEPERLVWIRISLKKPLA
ncbi:MAG: hypothetical protein HRU70_15490 [Phycisphaeraceae bacterium]|nr:MAG: hypothetical protein HRU70_15490 [Phycisphaeraceae bacterium]